MSSFDLTNIIRLEKSLFSDPWPESIFNDDIRSESSYPIVVQIDNAIIGYAILRIEGEDGHLTNIAVDKKYQRKSIAKKILSFILNLASENNLSQVLLEVRPSNKAAIALYESFGFIKLAIQKGYYQDPVEDCYIMKKAVSISLG